LRCPRSSRGSPLPARGRRKASTVASSAIAATSALLNAATGQAYRGAPGPTLHSYARTRERPFQNGSASRHRTNPLSRFADLPHSQKRLAPHPLAHGSVTERSRRLRAADDHQAEGMYRS
jgi:hypothetical protein